MIFYSGSIFLIAFNRMNTRFYIVKIFELQQKANDLPINLQLAIHASYHSAAEPKAV